MCGGEKIKCLSEILRQIVAFIPRLKGSRVMAQLGTRWYSEPFEHRRAGLMEEEEQRPNLADV